MNTVLSPAGLPAYLGHASNPSVSNHPAAPARAFVFVHALFLLRAAGQRTMRVVASRGNVSQLGLGRGFAQRSQARRSAWPNRVYVASCLHDTALRTGCSPPAASHPVLPRRSSLRLQAGELPPGGDFHPAVWSPSQAHERGSVTRRTWGCSDALRLTEPRSHRVAQVHGPNACAKRKKAFHERPFRPRRRSRPRPRLGGLDSRTRTTSTRTKRFMVPMHAEKSRKRALHEPEQGRQVLDCASPLALSPPTHAGKSGRGLPHSTTLSRHATARGRLMASMRSQEAVEALHEPPFRPRRRSRPRPRLGGLDSRTRTTSTRTKRFMVPMHAQSERGLSMNLPSRSAGL